MLAFCALALLAAVFTTLGLVGGTARAPVAGPSSPAVSDRSTSQSDGPLPDGSTGATGLASQNTWSALVAGQAAAPVPTVPAVDSTSATPTGTASATPAAARAHSTSSGSTSGSTAPATRPRHHRQPRSAPTPTATATTTSTSPGPGNGHGKGQAKGHASAGSTGILVSAPSHPGKGRGH